MRTIEICRDHWIIGVRCPSWCINHSDRLRSCPDDSGKAGDTSGAAGSAGTASSAEAKTAECSTVCHS